MRSDTFKEKNALYISKNCGVLVYGLYPKIREFYVPSSCKIKSNEGRNKNLAYTCHVNLCSYIVQFNLCARTMNTIVTSVKKYFIEKCTIVIAQFSILLQEVLYYISKLITVLVIYFATRSCKQKD